MPSSGRKAAPEAMFTIAPPPCPAMIPMASWQQKKTPRRLTPSTASQCSSVTSSSGDVG